MASITPYYDSNGKLISYRIRVSRGRDANGKILSYYRTSFKVRPGWSEETARKKAEAFASNFEAKCRAGQVSENRQTFEEYCNYVIKLKENRGAKPSTISNYRILTQRIYPEIGNIKLKDLKASDLNNLYSRLSEADNKNYASRAVPKNKFGDLLKQKGITRKKLSELSGVALHTVAETVNGKETSVKSAQAIADALGVDIKKLFEFTGPEPHKLSPKSVLEHHRLIHTVLKQAIKEDIVPYNVADKAEPPCKDKTESDYYSEEQILKIRQTLEDAPIKWKALVYLFLSTGCRRGEILALKWADTDLEKNQIDIHSNLTYVPGYGLRIDTPKTAKSSRKLAIPNGMVVLLKQYKEWQETEKVRLGTSYQDQGLIFTREDGRPMNPSSVNKWMTKLDERCGFHVHPHAFRHSVASVLIFAGLDDVTVSKHMGHADVSTTIDIYAHIMEKAETKSAEILSDVIFSEDKEENKDTTEE